MSWLFTVAYTGVAIFCFSQAFYPLFMLTAMLFRQSRAFYSFFHKADTSLTKHGGELVAQVIKSHGVSNVFTLPGGHVSPINVAAEKLNIRIVDVRHEATAVFAADASARISGIPGVAVVTAGPGLTNTVTAIKNAQLAESPIVVVAGAAATMLKGRGSLQDIDQISLLKTAAKKCFSVDCVRDIVPTMREAFRVAQVDVPGPVFVELPVDILYPYSIISKQFAAMSSTSSSPSSSSSSGVDADSLPDAGSRSRRKPTFTQRIVNAYANYKLNYIFADGFVDQDTDPLPLSLKSASGRQVAQAADLLTSARRPLIIAGAQSVLGPIGADGVAATLRKLGAPVYLNGAARGLMGSNYMLQFRHARKEAIKEADCILLLGAVCDFRLSYGQIFKKTAKIISVNRSLAQAKLNSGVFWNPSLAIESDIGKFVTDLEQVIKDSTNATGSLAIDSDWFERLRKRDTAKEASIDLMAKKAADKHLNPLKVLTELRKCIDDNDKDTVLVADGGDFVASASYIVRPKRPLRWLDPGPFGTLGCGAGFALAAKLLLPNANVICIMGDGAFGYAVPELDTFVRHKLPSYWLIGNDACWTQIVREQVPMLGSPVGCELAFTDYDRVAEGFGAHGNKISSDSELGVIKEALDKTEAGKTVVVNALIGKTTFRDGSISV